MNRLTIGILLILFFIIIFIIIIFIIIIAKPPSPGPAPTPTTDTEGTFKISNVGTDFLKNLKSLTFKGNEYVKKSDSVGIQFTSSGRYKMTINYNYLTENDEGNDFLGYMTITSTSMTNDISYSWKELDGQVNGPTIIETNNVSFCIKNDRVMEYFYALQKSEDKIGGDLSPIIITKVGCKTNNQDTCYSNYYTYDVILYIDEKQINTTYYIQTAFYSSYPKKIIIDTGGIADISIKQIGKRRMTGSGNLTVKYLGV